MEKKDILLKEYLGENMHFCDFINGVLFEGKEVLKPNQVEHMPSELLYVKELTAEKLDSEATVKTIHRFRDLTKKCDLNGKEVIIAIQNQTTVDFGMPIRIMTEDALDYDMQQKQSKDGKLHQGEKILPVISVVFYYGSSRWRAATNLSELIQIPDELKQFEHYIQQYSIILVTPWNTDASRLTGGWQEIFDVLARQNREEELKAYLEENKQRFSNLPEKTNRLLFALIGRLQYYDEFKRKGEVINMCKAFDDHYKSGVKYGISQGLEQGIFAMIRENREEGGTMEKIINKLHRYFSLERDEALSYIAKCN